jgi:hypothetical protein
VGEERRRFPGEERVGKVNGRNILKYGEENG